MKYSFIKFLLILFWAVLLVQCQKERDEYYKVPDWSSGKPIYETLQDKGNFSKYLQLADKTHYAASLKGNGLWTVFAPNDAAVDAWLKEKGYASVDDVSVSVANKVVAYSMLFNKYRFDQLPHVLNDGWDSLQSVKKRTLYYETIHKEFSGMDSVWVVGPTISNMYSTNENNYKYLPYYLDAYFVESVRLSASDYIMLYPASEYTGKNVQRASVLEQDIVAGNGFIHETDKVNEPLPNFEDILKEADYSMFRSLIEAKNPLGQPYFYQYLTNPSISDYFRKMYPMQNIEEVNIKFYNLPVPLNCERYVSSGSRSTGEGELGGYTLFVPNNEGVQKFYKERLAEYYGEYPAGMAKVPVEIWSYFFNAQMVDGLVYPQQFRLTANFAGDYLNGEGIRGPELNTSVYSDIRPASNGLFYGGNDYIKTSMFETVFSEILLRSKYSMMLNAMAFYFGTTLSTDLMKSQLSGDPDWDYTVLLLSDEQLQREAESPGDGFSWEPLTNAYGFRHSFTDNISFADTRMQRLIRSHVFKRVKSYKLDFNAGNPEYGGYGYAVNEYGDMIRFKDGKVQMLGNYDKAGDSPEDNWVTVTPITSRSFNNGTVYTVDKPLQYSICTDDGVGSCNERPMIDYLQEVAERNPNVSKSVEYLVALLNGSILSLSADAFYTILLPDNASIDQAVADNVISTFASDQVTLTRALAFFQYHILPGTVFVDDGYGQLQMPTGNIAYSQDIATLYKLPLSSTYLTVKKEAGKLFFETYRNPARSFAFVAQGENRSNQFGAKSVIHEIDNYFLPQTE